MKIRKGFATSIFAGATALATYSAQAIELTRVQKKLDQFQEYNSCSEESRTSQFPSVFLHLKSDNASIRRIDKAIIETDFSDFAVSFDHEKGEYFYRDIFSKERHFEQIHKICDGNSCTFNVVVYPNILFPRGSDNSDVRIRFEDKHGTTIAENKVNIGPYDAYAFEDQLIPFEAHMEAGKIIVKKHLSEHKDNYYTAGLHIGLGDKKHEIDVVVNKQQMEEGILLSYPQYSDITYLGIYMEPSNYDKSGGLSRVENKIELFDQEKPFFNGCKP